ncbi:MAG: hypothetical protein NW214_10940 [Pseudanabaenaceae cyanobacterium bins.39]|nr:hypothetical protein [Pseudanabaenaceae cyanobacterium bins.39]
MTTHFISAEVAIDQNQEEIVKTVEEAIAKQGNPLRWAITSVHEQVDPQAQQNQQFAQVEAVVTRDS